MRSMDTELVYNFIGLDAIYEDMQRSKSFDILASKLKSVERVAMRKIEALVEQYQ